MVTFDDRKPPVTFTLPESFRPLEFLRGPLAMHADDARWLLSTILRKTAAHDTDSWDYVRLHSDIKRRVMGQDRSATITRALVKGGAIETAPYSVGVRSKGYRLTARYLGDRCVRVRATNPWLIERVQREHDRQQAQVQASGWLPIHDALAAEQRHVTIVGDEADRIRDGLPDQTRLGQDVLISNIQHREPCFVVCDTGRVFNAITGLKRELRTALRIDGERVGSVDIACAQPALLAMLLSGTILPNAPNTPPTGGKSTRHKGTPGVLLLPCSFYTKLFGQSKTVIGPDLARFSDAVRGGSFYELLVDLSGFGRDKVKHQFLVDVLAKKRGYPSPLEDLFHQEFPSVFRAIRQINKHDHGTLIRSLQQAESALVVEQVSQRLLWSGVRFVTLHDAVFAGVGSLGAVEAAFAEVFDEIGFPLSLKTSVEPIA